jgi:exonuclease SbcD
MRIAALSDIHLGYRGPVQRQTPSGHDVREMDVAHAFRAAIDGILTAKPDLVCICGDLFHIPLPRPAPIRFAFVQLRRLRDAGLPVVLIAGNHDRNRTVQSGSILPLFAELGIDVATDQVREFSYPALDLSVTAVPDSCPLDEIQPGAARYRVLVIHGGVEGTCPGVPGVIPRSLVESEEWSWVCLGDYHVQKQVTPRAWYSGSLEFTSSNIWSEAGTPKGWLLIDVDAGTVEPQLVPTREVLDLEPIEALDRTPKEIDALLAERLASITGKLVRLRVWNISAEVSRKLDCKQIKRAKGEALHLLLKLVRPAVTARERQQGGKSQTLSEIVGNWLAGYEFSPGIDRAAVAKLGSELMAEAAEDEAQKMAKRGAA